MLQQSLSKLQTPSCNRCSCNIIVGGATKSQQVAKGSIDEAIQSFFLRGKDKYGDKIARFRASPKVHKSPWALRPVIAKCGTYIECLRGCPSNFFGMHIMRAFTLFMG